MAGTERSEIKYRRTRAVLLSRGDGGRVARLPARVKYLPVLEDGKLQKRSHIA